jgi:XTP/dITP diphosphohydrolase
MNQLIVATKNEGKLREIKELLADLDVKVLSLKDFPQAPEIVEDGTSFAQNAIKKAATIALYTKTLTLGEDSGIQVKALGNKPGIYSARFAGPKATDKSNNRKLLRSLKGLPASKRQAKYHCCIALIDGKRIIDVVHGECSGIITEGHRGENGFGYDPLFLIHRYNKTFGELPPAIKSKISHRARALKKVRKVLELYFHSKKRDVA